MPTDKKRINLTVPEKVYLQLQEYKFENGIESDATACLQLVVKQLKAQEDMKRFMALYRSISPDELRKLSNEGLDFLNQNIDKL